MENKMTRFLSLAACCLMLLAAACSKDSDGDVAELLKTVPADAGTVVSVNVRSLAVKADCKVEDGKITLSPSLQKSLASMKDAGMRKKTEMLLDGKSGIAVTSLVVFDRGYHRYITGLLDDPGAFKSFLASGDKKYQFKETGGIEYAADVAIKGNQFWSLSVGEIDPLDVKEFSELPEGKSFISTDYAEKLVSGDYDVKGLADVSRLMGDGGFVKQAQTQMALQTVFSDAVYLEFMADFRKGSLAMEASVLTSKFKPAKCNFPLSKIDTDAVKSIPGTGNVAFAVGASSKLVEKVNAMLSQAGAIGKIYAQILAPVSGTVAVLGQSGGQPGDMRLNGLVQTGGKELNPLTTVVGEYGIQWRLDGKDLVLSTAQQPQGGISAEAFAKECKGAFFACMADSRQLKSYFGNDRLPVRHAVVRMEPSEGSVKLKATVESDTEEKNLLAAAIEAMM